MSTNQMNFPALMLVMLFFVVAVGTLAVGKVAWQVRADHQCRMEAIQSGLNAAGIDAVCNESQ